jgi:phospholipase/lecithinase/hemolysin
MQLLLAYDFFRRRKMILDTKITHLKALLIGVLMIGMHDGLWAKDGLDNVYIFGDSLSDPGNVYALTGQTAKAPYEPIPSVPYATGGHQFSNGKTWAQRFSQSLRLNKSGKAAYGSSGRFGNYAFGGARLVGPSLAASAADQVNLYFTDQGGAADGDALHVIQFGGNDVRDAFVAYLVTGQDAAEAVIKAAIAAEIDLILQLYGSGAKNFLVVNSPNIGLAPAIAEFGPAAQTLGAGLSAGFNRGLADALKYYIPSDASVKILDLFGLINGIAANPVALGIIDTTSPCLTFEVKSGAKCSNPETYLFWDAVHPTAAVHKHIGNVAATLYQ